MITTSSVLIACLFLPKTLSFMKPPSGILPSTVLSEARSIHKASFEAETWHQPKLHDPFTSVWYYWQSTPGQKTNENIDYGTLKWQYNGTHMYYHFNIPSLRIDFHEYIINNSLYLWTQNNSHLDCYSYHLQFDIIPNYFMNSSFVGLTNSPYIHSIGSGLSNITTTTPAPTSDYPMKEAEAMWVGYLFTERVFGRNMTYIVTSKQNGSIGRLYIALNADNIDLQHKAAKSEVMWLKNRTWNPWNEDDIGIKTKLPNKCLLKPLDAPTMAPTASPLETQAPSKSPTVSPDVRINTTVCSLPSIMVILYVILIALFLLLLFCWYARKNSVISRMMHGAEHSSVAISSERYHHYQNSSNNNRYKYKSNPNAAYSHNNKSKSPKHHNNKPQHMYRGNPYENRYNQHFAANVARKTSDYQYVGDDDSDIEYVTHREDRDRYRKMSKLSNSDMHRDADDDERDSLYKS